jgi:adenine-specific DNA-methyltransferase
VTYKKPPLEVQATTLWDFPSQHYGTGVQGDPDYVGATPSYVIWNLLERYTRRGDVIVDVMCGSGTTLDVAKDLERQARGFDIAPYRADIERADARHVPMDDNSADFVFVDPPYSTHVEYSDDPDCIGKLDAQGEAYYAAMSEVIAEIHRILKPNRYMALYVCDSWKKKQAFMPIGFRLFSILERHFKAVDIVSVVRHNRTLKRRRWQTEAVKGNFFLRGFNYLFIMKKEQADGAGKPVEEKNRKDRARQRLTHRKPRGGTGAYDD